MSRNTAKVAVKPDDILETQIESPCIGVCEIDMASGFCRGCGRKSKEISAWRSLEPQQRQEILEQLPARLPLTRKRRGGANRNAQRRAQKSAQD
ncbi:MAG: DUF1289 domain-containing protein [Hyphomicrobiales bacterium]|nr:DUF1289 domain-containing protein [Hyphomicrobiales bacterium]MCY4033157.1 DUF1289 domain-containing protein [Hyphomicrobiales bacterium]MCY4038709.1 DUF1289 domain-containing protein [Hyphomicrobiales bacterium]